MAKSDDTPALPHPRQTRFVSGHGEAKQAFAGALSSGRFHHAWLITGPKGIGKATLAYHFARHLLSGGKGESPGEAGPDDPVFRRLAGRSEANLRVVERAVNEKTGNLRQEIIVEDVRGLHGFFDLTAAQPGWRVAIIDSADEMNPSAANALLKMLEEPPKQSALLLVSHGPGRLAATIRSRCRELKLKPVSEAEAAEALKRLFPDLGGEERAGLAKLSEGAPGFAARLAAYDGRALQQIVERVTGEGGKLPAAKAHELAGRLALKANEESYHLFMELLRRAVGRRIRALSLEGAPNSRLDCWLALWEKVSRLYREGEGLNLSRKQVLLVALEEAAAATGAASQAA